MTRTFKKIKTDNKEVDDVQNNIINFIHSGKAFKKVISKNVEIINIQESFISYMGTNKEKAFKKLKFSLDELNVLQDNIINYYK